MQPVPTHSTRRAPRTKTTAIVASMIAAALATASVPTAIAATGGATPDAVGAVYIATNDWTTGNQILAFPRFADGTLGRAAATATGGRGSGPGPFAPIVSDPLGSQNSLIADASEKLVFVVNAGSGSVSSLRANRGGLVLADTEATVPAGVTGQSNPFPVSLAYTAGHLYALNAIGNSVTGFTVNPAGHMTATQNCALPGLPVGNPLDQYPATALSSQQAVGTQLPGQVGVSPDGKWLVVVSKEGPMSTTNPPGGPGDQFPFGPTSGPGHIYAYALDASGSVDCAAPRTTTLRTFADGHGTFPFSFTWSAQGNLLMTEVFGGSDSPASLPGGLSTVTSYTLNADGTFTLQRRVADPLPVPCWIVRNGDNVYVANFLGPTFGLGAISAFKVAPDGGLIDTAPTAAPTATIGSGSNPIDMAITADGRYLYQLAPGSDLSGSGSTFQIYPFAVGPTGGLTALPAVNDGVGGAGAATHANAGEFGIAAITY